MFASEHAAVRGHRASGLWPAVMNPSRDLASGVRIGSPAFGPPGPFPDCVLRQPAQTRSRMRTTCLIWAVGNSPTAWEKCSRRLSMASPGWGGGVCFGNVERVRLLQIPALASRFLPWKHNHKSRLQQSPLPPRPSWNAPPTQPQHPVDPMACEVR